jgi:hypothetical protein
MARHLYNELKVQVLRVLGSAPHGWLTPREIAQRARFSRVRSAWSYLFRLYRWGLLRRRSAPYVEYSLTRKGRRRLIWLISTRQQNSDRTR